MDYNTIYEKFISLSGYDYSELPKTDELRYILINNGVALYNSKAKKYSDILQGGVVCDDDSETINKDLKELDLMILGYFMAFITASNKYAEYTAVWDTMANETGLKDYKAQCSAKESMVKYFRNQIDTLIDDEIDTFD